MTGPVPMHYMYLCIDTTPGQYHHLYTKRYLFMYMGMPRCIPV